MWLDSDRANTLCNTDHHAGSRRVKAGLGVLRASFIQCAGQFESDCLRHITVHGAVLIARGRAGAPTKKPKILTLKASQEDETVHGAPVTRLLAMPGDVGGVKLDQFVVRLAPRLEDRPLRLVFTDCGEWRTK